VPTSRGRWPASDTSTPPPFSNTRGRVPRRAPASLSSSSTSSCPHTHTPITSYADDFTDSQSFIDYTFAESALSEQATRVSQWAEEHGLTLSAPKSTVTLFISEKKTIQRDTTNHSQELYPLTRKTLPYPGGHSRSSIHLRPSHKQPRFPHHPPPQHLKSSCWHPLWPAKRNNSHRTQIHHPIRNHSRCSQYCPHQHKKTTDSSEHGPPHCYWLREDRLLKLQLWLATQVYMFRPQICTRTSPPEMAVLQAVQSCVPQTGLANEDPVS